MEEYKFAFKQTLPIMFSYIFMGIAFGIMLTGLGYGMLASISSGLFIYAGSLQFALIGLLQAHGSLMQATILSLLINARHIFYGLTFIERFRKMGIKRYYMIFALTDETYSILCDLHTPSNLNEDKVMFLIALFNHIYWIIGCIVGAILNGVLPFNLDGIEFSATAFFIIVVMNQWKNNKDHLPAIIGFICGIVCLVIFKADNFLIFALISCVILLSIIKARGENNG